MDETFVYGDRTFPLNRKGLRSRRVSVRAASQRKGLSLTRRLLPI
ncbi:hypothetical protein [Nostoc sp.]